MKKLIAPVIMLIMLIMGGGPLRAQSYVSSNFILTSTPEFILDANGTNNIIINSCETTNYIWGHGNSSKAVWKKSKNHGDWTTEGTPHKATAIFSDGKSNILLINISEFTGNYSTDEGKTWNQITRMPEYHQNYSSLDGWQFAAANGILVLGEYWAMGRQPPRIFRSIDNGATWETVYTEFNVDYNTQSHIHCLAYHAGMNCFVAVVGDGVNRAYLRSDAAGVNWARFMLRRGSQPVQLIDYGHPTRILCGSDTREGLCSTDLVTETSYNVLNDRWTVTELGGDGEVFAARKSDGIYYAFSYYEQGFGGPVRSFGGYRWPKCFVSEDGENWTTYHQMPANTSILGVRFTSGTAQGYLHLTAYDANGIYTCYKLKKPQISNYRTGKLIQSNAPNLLDNLDKSCLATENAIQYWEQKGQGATLNFENSRGLFGSNCLKSTKSSDVNGFILLATRSNPAAIKYSRDGKRVYGRAWVRGETNNRDLAFSFSNNQLQPIYNSVLHTWTRWHLNDHDRWMEILNSTPGDSALGTGLSDGYLMFRVGDESEWLIPRNDSAEFYLGAAIVSFAPVTLLKPGENWQTSMEYSTPVANEWTSFCTILPDVPMQTVRHYWIPWAAGAVYDVNDYCTHHGGRAGQARVYRSLVNNNTSEPPLNWAENNDVNKSPAWHIKTFRDAYNNKLVLYLDCMPIFDDSLKDIEARRIKLDIYINGTMRQTLVSKSFAWDRRSQWQFVVSASSNIKLWFQHVGCNEPELIESTDNAITTALAGGAFKNRSIIHHLGDETQMQSLTFYVVGEPSIEVDYVPGTISACKTELNKVDGTENPIAKQPRNLTVCKNSIAVFEIEPRSDCQELHYQWKKNGIDIGIDDSKLIIDSAQPSDDGSVITCQVTSSNGSATSNPVILNVAELIAKQPQDVNVGKGSTAVFCVNAAPTNANVHYQWKKNGINTGTDSDMLLLRNVQLADDGAVITCQATNTYQSITSAPALLHVTGLITRQPQDVITREGTSVVFNVTAAAGCGQAHYSWKKDGLNIGWDGPSLTVYNVKPSDHNSIITCEVSNSCGSEFSSQARLKVCYFVQVNAGPNGSIQPSGSITALRGSRLDLTAKSNPGYIVSRWFMNGNAVANGGNIYTISEVKSDLDICVYFLEPIRVNYKMGNFLWNWLGKNSQADIAPYPSGNGIVNLNDFAVFANDWISNQ